MLQALRMRAFSQVPNIKCVEQLSVSEIARYLWWLQQLAEKGHLRQEDLEGVPLATAGSMTSVKRLFKIEHGCVHSGYGP